MFNNAKIKALEERIKELEDAFESIRWNYASWDRVKKIEETLRGSKPVEEKEKPF